MLVERKLKMQIPEDSLAQETLAKIDWEGQFPLMVRYVAE